MGERQAASDVSRLDRSPVTDLPAPNPEAVLARAGDAAYAASYDDRSIEQWRQLATAKQGEAALAEIRANNAGWPPRLDLYEPSTGPGQPQVETAEQQRMRSFLTEWHRRQQSARAGGPGEQAVARADDAQQRPASPPARRDIFQRIRQFKDILFGRAAGP